MTSQLRIDHCIDDGFRLSLESNLGARLASIASHVRGLDHIDPHLLRHALVAAANRALEVDVLPLLIRNWSKLHRIRKAIDSGASSSIALYEHSFRCTEDLDVEFTLEGLPLVSVTVQLLLDVELSGAILAIDEGSIQRVSLGRVGASIALLVAGEEVVRKELGAIALPDAFVASRSRPDTFAAFARPPMTAGTQRTSTFRRIPWT